MVSPVKIRPVFAGFVLFINFGLRMLFPGAAAGAALNSRNGAADWSLVLGTAEGLIGLDQAGMSRILWEGGAVRKILRQGAGGWVILTENGIFVSEDLRNWEARNQGLPVWNIKVYENGKKSFEPVVQEIKDLEIHPADSEIMVCAVKNAVYLTRNGGRSWENLGMPPYNTNGAKAVAVASLRDNSGSDNLTVFFSHGIYGIHYITPGKNGAVWTELNSGLEILETTGNPDEVSDIAVVGSGRPGSPWIYAAQTFRRRLYRLNWENKRFEIIWNDGSEFGTIDSLSPGKNVLRFLKDGGVAELAFTAGIDTRTGLTERRDLADFIRNLPASLGTDPLCVCLRENSRRADSEVICLSELWLLKENSAGPEAAPDIPAQALNREGIYLPVGYAMDSTSLKPYLDIIRERNLNMVVIDMKDDYGRLRFQPRDKALETWGRVFRPVDIDVLLKDLKARGVYTIARVVVFKDPETAKKDGGKYAVWDSRTGKPWEGYYDTRRKKPLPGEGKTEEAGAGVVQILPAEDPEYEIVRTWYDEKWVDPYSEDVWSYVAALAGELHGRGFDEIQFDYIRFPTDGVNLEDARYRWRDSGMDMDSAIVSFLRHVRSRVSAPISVDIYGANGWYRTGARTGQEVELLAPWVDVICPMYYPSHFEQGFLAQDPPEFRPYRIYYLGALRTSRIARRRVIVRPWVQAFYLNVSYDRTYYSVDYVFRETQGARDAGSGGLTYWNNSGRYDDILFSDKNQDRAD
jgi:hypothetical protein